MARELKNGDRLLDWDGDGGVARNVWKDPNTGRVEFDFYYDAMAFQKRTYVWDPERFTFGPLRPRLGQWALYALLGTLAVWALIAWLVA